MSRWVVVSLVICAACDRVPAPAPVIPLTADEAAQLARDFEAAIEPCSADKLDALVDRQQLVRVTIGKTHLRDAEKRGAIAAMEGSPFFGKQICPNFTPATTVDLLRIRTIDGQPKPLFRVNWENGGVNYYELTGGKLAAGGPVRLLDMYMYQAGDSMSTVMARVADASIETARVGLMPMAGADELRARGDFAGMRALIARQTPAVRDSKGVRILDLQAAVTLGSPDYLDVIDDYVRLFPGDPSIDFVMVDAYVLRHQVEPALAAIDRIDALIGGDPYLDYLRVAALLTAPTPARLADADRRARAVTAAFPDRVDMWWMMVAVQLARADFASLTAAIDVMHDRFDLAFEPAGLATDPSWHAYAASPEYAAWRAGLPQ